MNYNVPIYDPFGERSDDFYLPANEASEHLLQVAFAYEDIARLLGLIERASDRHDRKLLVKFAIVELLSLDEHLRKLVGLALSGKTGHPLSESESDNIKQLHAAYSGERKPFDQIFRDIRNKLGAHRDPSSLTAIAHLWDSIDPESVASIISKVHGLYEGLQGLNIYHWTKTEVIEGREKTAHVAPMEWGGFVLDPESTDEDGAGDPSDPVKPE